MGWDSPLGLVVAAAKGRRNPSASPNPNGLQPRQSCSPSHYNTYTQYILTLAHYIAMHIYM
jgi:hypothetical protein